MTIDDQMNCDTFARYPLYTYDEVAISYYGDHLEEECAVRIYEDFNHGRICLTIDTLDIYDCSIIVKLYGGSHIGEPNVVTLPSFLPFIHPHIIFSFLLSINSSFLLSINMSFLASFHASFLPCLFTYFLSFFIKFIVCLCPFLPFLYLPFPLFFFFACLCFFIFSCFSFLACTHSFFVCFHAS